jgi:hypothetical protein
MRKALFTYVVISASLLFLHGLDGNASGLEQGAQDEVNKHTNNLSSKDFDNRWDAVYFFYEYAKENPLDNKSKHEIKELYKREYKYNKEYAEILFDPQKKHVEMPERVKHIMTGSYAGNYGMFHVYLCELLGTIGDRSLLKMMADDCPMPEALLPFGDDAVGPVMADIMSSKHESGKWNGISVLKEMIKPKSEGYVVRGEKRKKVKKLLIKLGLEDESKSVNL